MLKKNERSSPCSLVAIFSTSPSDLLGILCQYSSSSAGPGFKRGDALTPATSGETVSMPALQRGDVSLI